MKMTKEQRHTVVTKLLDMDEDESRRFARTFGLTEQGLQKMTYPGHVLSIEELQAVTILTSVRKSPKHVQKIVLDPNK